MDAARIRPRTMTPISVNVSAFRSDGFVVVDNVLEASHVDWLRREVLRHSDRGLANARGVAIADFRRLSEFSFLHGLPDHPRVRAALDLVFAGEPYRYCSHNDIGIDRVVGWHKDKLNHEYESYQVSPLFPPPGPPSKWSWSSSRAGEGHFIVKAAFYLADHSHDDNALQLVPGSHMVPTTLNPRMASDAQHLHPRKGSMLIFEQRISHRGQEIQARNQSTGRVTISLGFGRLNRWTDEFEAGTRARQGNQSRCQDLVYWKRRLLEADGKRPDSRWLKQTTLTHCGGMG